MNRPDIDIGAVIKGARDIKKDHADRLENLGAIKGEKFKQAVEFIVMQTNLRDLTLSLLKMAGAPEMLGRLYSEVSAGMNADMSLMYCKAVGIELEELEGDDGVLVWARRLSDDLVTRTNDLANNL